MDKESKNKSINFWGPVNGPFHSGDGDINIENIHYDSAKESLSILKSDFPQLTGIPLENAITQIIVKLNENHLRELHQINKAITDKMLSEHEIEAFLLQLQSVISRISSYDLNPDSHSDILKINEIIKSPQLNIENKLKLSIPIIPLILTYEANLGLDIQTEINKLWNWLTHKKQNNNNVS
jgi:hypothetical protein